MSGKKFKQLLVQSSELDDIITRHSDAIISSSSSKKLSKTKEIIMSHDTKKEKGRYHNNNYDNNNELESSNVDEHEKKLKSQLESILFFDHAFSRRSEISEQSKKRKLKEIQASKKKRDKIKDEGDYLNGSLSNSRCSSSINSRRKHEPTFDKKKDAEKKRIKSLQDLARQLKKRQRK